MRTSSFVTAAAILALGIACHGGAQAADIRVLAAAAVEDPFEAVVHAFERDSSDKVNVTFGSVGAVQAKLKAGEKADLVILSTAAVAAAEKEGTVRPGSRAVVGRAEIGVAVREGAPVPDIATTDAVKRTLLAAKSVSFTDPAAGGTAATFVVGLLDRLGIADAIKKKTVMLNSGRNVVAAVAKGDAEIGITFTSEFIPVKGIKIVGTLPKEIEFVNEYSAYIPAASAAAEPAQALLAYLARPASRETFRAAGVVP
jgi:molybdate transport system substrate-binding protein